VTFDGYGYEPAGFGDTALALTVGVVAGPVKFIFVPGNKFMIPASYATHQVAFEVLGI
jgi:hypothetical protein